MSKFWTNSSSFILIVLCGVLFMGTAKAETATVLRVIDGDTCLLEDGRRVRYLGINSPEKGEPLIIEKISKHSKNLFESHLILFNIKQIIAT